MEEIDPISLARQAYLLIANLKVKLHADYINQICDPLLDYTLESRASIARTVLAIKTISADIANMLMFNSKLLKRNDKPSEDRSRLIRNKGLLEQVSEQLYSLNQLLLQVGSDDESSRLKFIDSLRGHLEGQSRSRTPPKVTKLHPTPL